MKLSYLRSWLFENARISFFLGTFWRLALLEIIFGSILFGRSNLGCRRHWLDKLSRLWLLETSLESDVEFISRQAYRNAWAINFPLIHFLLAVGILGFHLLCTIELDKLVLLVQKRKPSFDDLSSLQSLGHIKLEGVKSNLPFLPDFCQCIIDDLANTGPLTNLN